MLITPLLVDLTEKENKLGSRWKSTFFKYRQSLGTSNPQSTVLLNSQLFTFHKSKGLPGSSTLNIRDAGACMALPVCNL